MYRGILLKNGQINDLGEIHSVINTYIERDSKNLPEHTNHTKNDLLVINKLRVLGNDGALIINHTHIYPFYILIDFTIFKANLDFYFAFHIHDEDLQTLIFDRKFSKDFIYNYKIGENISMKIKIPPTLAPGKYNISIHVAQSHPAQLIQGFDNVCNFEIHQNIDSNFKHSFQFKGKIFTNIDWKLI